METPKVTKPAQDTKKHLHSEAATIHEKKIKQSEISEHKRREVTTSEVEEKEKEREREREEEDEKRKKNYDTNIEHHANDLKPFAENIILQENLAEQHRREISRKSIEKYQIGKKLGEGAFSVVYQAINLTTNEKVAIKVIKKYQLDEKQRNSVLKEVNIMKQLNHPNIVKLIEFIENDNYYYIVQEVVSGGEIFNEIVKYTYFSEDLSRHVIIQVAEALLYMHEYVGIVHRDLKPENIFFKPIKFFKDDPKNRFNKLRKSDNPNTKLDEGKFIMNYGGGGIGLIKVGDFGLSKQILLNDENNSLKTPCGTIGYTAPEIVRDMKYSKEVDMWALGCVLYILLCGFPPFFNDSIDELTRSVARGEFKFLSPWWDEISPGAKNCVSKLLTVNPLQRYTVKQFLQDPWILEFLNKSENIQAKEKSNASEQSTTIPPPTSLNNNKNVTPDRVENGVNRVSSGMPGLNESNAKNGIISDRPLNSYQSVYSSSLLHIEKINEMSLSDSKNDSNSDSNSEDDEDDEDSEDEEFKNLVGEFGTELSRFAGVNEGNNNGEDLAVLEHLLEPGPAQTTYREEMKSENNRNDNNNNSSGQIRKKKKYNKNTELFTPEVRAMKDMYDISIAARRMHEEGEFNDELGGEKLAKIKGEMNNGGFDNIIEEGDENEEDSEVGNEGNNVTSLRNEVPAFQLNMNDASILARRQKKRIVV